MRTLKHLIRRAEMEEAMEEAERRHILAKDFEAASSSSTISSSSSLRSSGNNLQPTSGLTALIIWGIRFLQRHFRGWWTWAYLFDWILVVSILVIETPYAYLVAEPYHRFLPENDPSVTFPVTPSIVPTWAVALLILVPISIFVAIQLMIMASMHDLHHACLGLFESLVFSLIITDGVKIACGRYRPDWLGRQISESPFTILDGRQSFPSGHSSVSFAMMVFLSLYLAGKVGLFRKNGGAAWKAILCMLPCGISTAVAVSRTRDYHHDFTDIVAGTMLGTFIAVFCYFLQYPSLFGDDSHWPKSRTEGQQMLYFERPGRRLTDKGDEDYEKDSATPVLVCELRSAP